MEAPTATGVSCSHDEEYCSDRGPENVNPPTQMRLWVRNVFVANDESHDFRFIIPESSSR